MTEGPTASGDGAGLKQVLAFRSPPLTLTEAHGGMAGWSVWQPRPTAQGSVAPGTPILLGRRVGASFFSTLCFLEKQVHTWNRCEHASYWSILFLSHPFLPHDRQSGSL